MLHPRPTSQRELLKQSCFESVLWTHQSTAQWTLEKLASLAEVESPGVEGQKHGRTVGQ